MQESCNLWGLVGVGWVVFGLVFVSCGFFGVFWSLVFAMVCFCFAGFLRVLGGVLLVWVVYLNLVNCILLFFPVKDVLNEAISV